MEDSSLSGDPIAPAPAPDQPQAIAPWWHTAALLLLLAAWAAISGARTHAYTDTPRPIIYISMTMMTWMFFGTTVAGIIDRRAFFFSTLRNKARSFTEDATSGLVFYLGIYFFAAIVAMIVSGATTFISHHEPVNITQPSTQTESQPTTPIPPPTPAPVTPLNKSHFQLDSKTVRAIAPHTPLELLLWIAVSCTAGFCEEHIFRGYLLKQALACTARAGLSPLLATILSIVATSLIFGSLHLYEGVGGACLIAALGAIYSVIALKLGNLRAVIAAHFLQDFCAGVFLFFLHARMTH